MFGCYHGHTLTSSNEYSVLLSLIKEEITRSSNYQVLHQPRAKAHLMMRVDSSLDLYNKGLGSGMSSVPSPSFCNNKSNSEVDTDLHHQSSRTPPPPYRLKWVKYFTTTLFVA